MHLTRGQESELKTWIIHRLDDMNDLVDADIFADLAVGLLRSDEEVEVLRNEVLSNLDDILEAETDAFVQDLFREAIRVQHDSTAKARTKIEAPPLKSPLNVRNKRKHEDVDCERSSALPTPHLQHSLTNYANKQRRHNNDLQHRSVGETHLYKQLCDWTKPGATVRDPTTQGSLQQNPMFTPTQDLNDPTLPMKIAAFRMMKENYPFLTQMWLFNMRQHGQEVPDWVLNPDYDYMAAAPLSDETLASSAQPEQPRCSDYEATGLCIRGDLCPYLHDGSPFQEQARRERAQRPQAAGKPHKRKGKPKFQKKRKLNQSSLADGYTQDSRQTVTDTTLNHNATIESGMDYTFDSEPRNPNPHSSRKRTSRHQAQHHPQMHDTAPQYQSNSRHYESDLKEATMDANLSETSKHKSIGSEGRMAVDREYGLRNGWNRSRDQSLWTR